VYRSLLSYHRRDNNIQKEEREAASLVCAAASILSATNCNGAVGIYPFT